jgi:hypothetical protein
MGILGLVNVRVYTKGSWLRFATHIVFGVALCLLSILATANDGDGAVVLGETAWPLPIVAIVVFVGTSYPIYPSPADISSKHKSAKSR